MNILLIGPSNSGKAKFVEELKEREELKDFRVSASPWTVAKTENIAIGELSDYRAEAYLAASRSIEMTRGADIILKHSLLDSVAHISARVRALVDLEQMDEQWAMVMYLAAHMLNDSFKYDIVVEFDPVENEDSYFNNEVYDSLQVLIKELKLTTIKPEVDKIINEIQRLNQSNGQSEEQNNSKSMETANSL